MNDNCCFYSTLLKAWSRALSWVLSFSFCLGTQEKKNDSMATSNLESSVSLHASQYQHTPFFCEENVYLLCKKLSANGIADSEGSDIFVVIISNEKKQVPLWCQKASHRADGAVLWDYHVICVQRKTGGSSVPLVWDLDSSLPFPSPLKTYVAETIRPSFSLFSEYERYFRVVHAPIFLRNFASDRRHMRDSAGNWTADPPTYDPIIAEDGTVHNLNEYMEIRATDKTMDTRVDLVDAFSSKKLGVVVGESQLEEFFSRAS